MFLRNERSIVVTRTRESRDRFEINRITRYTIAVSYGCYYLDDSMTDFAQSSEIALAHGEYANVSPDAHRSVYKLSRSTSAAALKRKISIPFI